MIFGLIRCCGLGLKLRTNTLVFVLFSIDSRVLGLDLRLFLCSFIQRTGLFARLVKIVEVQVVAKDSEGFVSGIETAETEACSENASAEPIRHCLELLELRRDSLRLPN